MTRSKGFVYYDLWILVVVVAIVAAVIVPSFLRASRKVRLRRAEVSDLRRIADIQHFHHARYRAFLDSLPLTLAAGTHLVALRSDSTGWSAVITSDSAQNTGVSCGIFEGPPDLAPTPEVTMPGRVICW